MQTLRELQQEYMELLTLMEDPDVDPEVIKDTMEGISGAIEVKADAYATVRDALATKQAQLGKEIQRLSDWAETIQNNIKKLDHNLAEAMMATGKLKFETEHYRFNYKKNGGLIPLIFNEGLKPEDIPEEYQKQRISITADTDKIRKTLATGAQLDFVRMGERGRHLEIR